MRDTTRLAALDRQVAYLVQAATPAQIHELAHLALLLHVVREESMSETSRATFDETLRGIGPEFLLTFRALRQHARAIIRNRRNWRTRT